MHMEFPPTQWQRIREDYTAWWRGELDRAIVYATYVVAEPKHDFSNVMTNWPADLSDDKVVDVVLDTAACKRYYGDAFPYHFLNYGPGIAAVFTGAGLRTAPDTVWFEPPEKHELSDLIIGLDRDNPWWRRIRHQTQALAERIGSQVQISVTDLGGNLDILASLRGTEALLLDCAVEPGEVVRLVGDITRLWLEVFDELHFLITPHCPGSVSWPPVWAPGRTVMLQSDFSYMISDDMFKQFVQPDLEACCEAVEYAFYHLDGPGELSHIDTLCAMEKLRGIQWIPGAGRPEASEWPEVLGRIREAGKLCQIFATPREAINTVRRHGAKGFLFVVDTEGMGEAEVRRFAEEFPAG